MDVQGLQMTQNSPAPGVYKRNPPIAGEAEAIEAAKNGDAEAFSKLYALHKRRVYTLCLRMLGNVSEAEDMTQEAFLHLFRKIGSFRGVPEHPRRNHRGCRSDCENHATHDILPMTPKLQGPARCGYHDRRRLNGP